jgi:hypothetical protein
LISFLECPATGVERIYEWFLKLYFFGFININASVKPAVLMGETIAGRLREMQFQAV